MLHTRDDGFTKADAKPSFFVRILFRQNTSWQGEIQWMEGQRTRRFRSALELLSLIEEALELSESPEACYEFRHWVDGEEEERPSCSESVSSQ